MYLLAIVKLICEGSVVVELQNILPATFSTYVWYINNRTHHKEPDNVVECIRLYYSYTPKYSVCTLIINQSLACSTQCSIQNVQAYYVYSQSV